MTSQARGADRGQSEDPSGGRRYEGALRVAQGGYPGLSRWWRHGRVAVGCEGLTFERYVLGVRVRRPFTSSVKIDSKDIRPSDRKIGLLEQIWVNPRMTFHTVTVDGAVLELATPPARSAPMPPAWLLLIVAVSMLVGIVLASMVGLSWIAFVLGVMLVGATTSIGQRLLAHRR